jgi:hypothetical protein
MIGPDGRYRCVTEAWARTYSVPGEYLPPDDWVGLVHPERMSLTGLWLASFRGALDGVAHCAVDYVTLPGDRRADGEGPPVAVFWSLSPWPDGSVCCSMVRLSDVATATARAVSPTPAEVGDAG